MTKHDVSNIVSERIFSGGQKEIILETAVETMATCTVTPAGYFETNETMKFWGNETVPSCLRSLVAKTLSHMSDSGCEPTRVMFTAGHSTSFEENDSEMIAIAPLREKNSTGGLLQFHNEVRISKIEDGQLLFIKVSWLPFIVLTIVVITLHKGRNKVSHNRHQSSYVLSTAHLRQCKKPRKV